MNFITKIKTKLFLFSRMSLKKKIMFFLNFFLCGVARASINLFPLYYLMPYFGEFNKTTIISTVISKKQTHQAWQIGKSIRLAAKFTPWDSSCLTQAMVAKFWCALFKIPYAFYIGLAKSAKSSSGYDVHAWITAGPVTITGGNSWTTFHVISSYFSRKNH